LGKSIFRHNRIDAPKGRDMATATSLKLAKKPLNRWKMAGAVLLSLIVLALLWLAFNFSALKGRAQLGVAYSAHVVCSCRYIAGRDIKSCLSDLEPGTESVSLSDDPENKRIQASVPFLASATAERRDKFGCIILNEAEMKAVK
jgi:hypothetical protein